MGKGDTGNLKRGPKQECTPAICDKGTCRVNAFHVVKEVVFFHRKTAEKQQQITGIEHKNQ